MSDCLDAATKVKQMLNLAGADNLQRQLPATESRAPQIFGLLVLNDL
jgi:hypothetical protein